MTTFNDWLDWSEAHSRFVTLRDMSQMSTRLRAGATNAADNVLSLRAVETGLASADWSLHQAALELEAARDEAKLSTPPAAAAKAAAA